MAWSPAGTSRLNVKLKMATASRAFPLALPRQTMPSSSKRSDDGDVARDKRRQKTMSSDVDKSGEGTKTVGQKLDAVFTAVDERFTALSVSVDERFDAVDAALIEQRQYTEFAFKRLSDETRKGFEAVNARLDGIDGRLDGIDGRFDGVDGRFDRLERKLDQFIDTQSRANELVERRLTRLESQSGHK
jgi:hypothetical protein